MCALVYGHPGSRPTAGRCAGVRALRGSRDRTRPFVAIERRAALPVLPLRGSSTDGTRAAAYLAMTLSLREARHFSSS